MLESKRLPREIILEKQTPVNSLEAKGECLRLMGFVKDVKESMRKTRRNRDKVLTEAHQLTAQAKRLSERSLLYQKISLTLDAIGLVISGGSATAAKRALGDAIGTISGIFGLTTNEKEIKDLLLKSKWKMEKFESLNGKLNHFEQGLQKAFEKMEKLGCPVLF